MSIENVNIVKIIARASQNSTSSNPTTASIMSAVATTATSIMSAAASATSGAPNGKANDKNSNPLTNDNSKIFPIACTICGIIFVCAVYLYIFHSGNKTSSNDANEFMNNRNDDFFLNGKGNKKNNNYTIDIQVPEKSHNYPSQNKSNNLSSQNTSAIKSVDSTFLNMSSDNNTSFNKPTSPYSDTHNLLDVNRNNLNFMNGSLNGKPEKVSTPNPIFGPYKYIPKSQLSKSNESDITDENYPQNLNILTQEETKLLKMKKNININNDINNVNMGMKMNMNTYSTDYESINPSYFSLGRLKNNTNKNNTEAMKMNNYQNYMMDENVNNNNNDNNNNKKKLNTHRRSLSTPDLTAVAPFNYVNYENKNVDEIFRKDSRESFYDDSFIRNLGSDVKIETKKIEYVESEDSPINKIKIKRLNN